MGPSLSGFLQLADELGSWRKGAKAAGIDVEERVTRWIPLDEPLPWDFIVSPGGEVLLREYRRAFDGVPVSRK